MKKLTTLIALCAVIAIYTIIAPSAVSAEGVVQRGAAIAEEAKSVPLASLLAQPQHFTTAPVVTEGVVQGVCRIAGCWMKVASTADQEGMRVTFDGFTVPRRSRGWNARLAGSIEMKNGKPSFVATGVELTK